MSPAAVSPPATSAQRLVLAALAVGGLFIGVLVAAVLPLSADLRAKMQRAIIDRDAAVLHPVALQQLADREAASTTSVSPAEILSAVLASARQPGVLAVINFDADGERLRALPASLLLPELAASDYLQLLARRPITRFHPQFSLDRYFAGISANQPAVPVLEVLLPLHGRDETELLGFAQYFIDGRPLAAELAAVDARIDRQTLFTTLAGSGLIALITLAAYLGLRRAQKTVVERNERLARANFELTLSAKASAIGQIASHLIHGLQGPVAGLRAVVAERSGNGGSGDWRAAADYTEHLQALIHETVAMLGDFRTHTAYELSGDELVASVRQRSQARAARLDISLNVASAPGIRLDSHRGSLLCLIASNLVENALSATPEGGGIEATLTQADDTLVLTVTDNGPGIPEAVRAHLFAPGRSGRPEGSGLGLAISQLLARQMDASLALVSTGPGGTTFRLTLPTGGGR